MFIEFRRYVIKNDYVNDWIRIMEDKIFPFIADKGMVVLGSYRAPYDKSQYVWLRSFPDDIIRVKQYKAVYESEFWGKEIIPNADKMLEWEGIKVVRFLSDNPSLSYSHQRYNIEPSDYIEFRRFRAKPDQGALLQQFIKSTWEPYLVKQGITPLDFFTLPEFNDEYVLMVKYKDPACQDVGKKLEDKMLFATELDPLLKETVIEAPLLVTTDQSRF